MPAATAWVGCPPAWLAARLLGLAAHQPWLAARMTAPAPAMWPPSPGFDIEVVMHVEGDVATVTGIYFRADYFISHRRFQVVIGPGTWPGPGPPRPGSSSRRDRRSRSPSSSSSSSRPSTRMPSPSPAVTLSTAHAASDLHAIETEASYGLSAALLVCVWLAGCDVWLAAR